MAFEGTNDQSGCAKTKNFCSSKAPVGRVHRWGKTDDGGGAQTPSDPLSTSLSGKGVTFFTKTRSIGGLCHHTRHVTKLRAEERGPGAFSPVPHETDTGSQGGNSAVSGGPETLRGRAPEKPGIQGISSFWPKAPKKVLPLTSHSLGKTGQSTTRAGLCKDVRSHHDATLCVQFRAEQ